MNKPAAHTFGLLFIGTSIVFSAGAQLLMKAGMLELNIITNVTPAVSELTAIQELLPVTGWVLAGLALYALSMLTWLVALTKYDVSLAYPLLSLSYVLVYVAAVFWPRLHEAASLGKTSGILLILAGVLLVTRPARESQR